MAGMSFTDRLLSFIKVRNAISTAFISFLSIVISNIRETASIDYFIAVVPYMLFLIFCYFVFPLIDALHKSVYKRVNENEQAIEIKENLSQKD